MKGAFSYFFHRKGWTRKGYIVMLFTLFYIAFSGIYSFLNGNYEFVFYSVILLGILNLGIYVHRAVRLPEFIIAGLSVFGFMHVVGGMAYIDGVRLYDMIFYGLIRYDNIVHLIGSILAALVLNVLFYNFADHQERINRPLYYFALMLMTLGAGVFNEINEFFAVVFFNAQEGVGDYFNNAIDLLYNLIGALLAIILIDVFSEHRESVLIKIRVKLKQLSRKFNGG